MSGAGKAQTHSRGVTLGATRSGWMDEAEVSVVVEEGAQQEEDVAGGRKKGWATVKPEFRLDKMIPVTLATASSVAGEQVEKEEEGEEGVGESKGGQEEGEQAGGGRKGKKKGTNKKRPRDQLIDTEDQMCRVFISTGECQFGEKCRYTHDMADYMTRKPEDIGPMCPIWEMYGQCSAKITCRWGSSHYTKDGKELLRPEEQGGVKPVTKEMNELRKELMWQLRKKQYKFKTPRNSDQHGKNNKAMEFDLSPLPDKERKLIDFRNKVYVAPLTTVGNLPFRRVMKSLGADITCGEMALAWNLNQGHPSEWALLRRHPCEDIFGVQIAGAHADQMMRCAELLSSEVTADFVDLNLGCPLDLICDQGMGSSLMQRTPKLRGIVRGMTKILGPSLPLTIKMRTGWDDKKPIAHSLIGSIQTWVAQEHCNVAAVMVHGRSRQQRYTKTADWDYISKAAMGQDPSMPRVPVIGNGDIMSFVEYEAHKAAHPGIEPCAMLGRGALIKPWLPTEIKEQRHWDITATERLDILKQFVNAGLEHWGSDQRGVNTTRRFLLEWLSFLYRYVPVGLLEHVPQLMNDKPDPFRGRNELETLMASPYAQDWVAISEMLLGKVPDGFQFAPKHKSNAWEG